MKILMKQKFILLLSMAALSVSSCLELNGEEPGIVQEERAKDITGTWKIREAYRNQVDIMELMDFSQFRIKFSADEAYEIEHHLPFIVQQNGKWQLDDPQYPFSISFTPEGSDVVKTGFDYPITGGQRVMRLTFSPGCSNNEYLYVLEREDQ